MAEFEVRPAEWPRDRDALREVRTRVFIEEQMVPIELEWDELDADCTHVLAWSDGKPIGTGRLTGNGHIGRMAVLREWRGRGVGSRLLAALMEAARQRGDPACRLNAQVSAIGFYEHFGFSTCGKEFMEAGILHREMFLELQVD